MRRCRSTTLLAGVRPRRPSRCPASGRRRAPSRRPTTGPTQEKRAARAERALALLGKVNPLALEEFAALEERSTFLATQLEDLKAPAATCCTVVAEVDERIQRGVRRRPSHDTAREFEHVFATLFPGGEGKLVLTDPDDLLATGIEVEARPPGKKVIAALAAVRRRALADRDRPAAWRSSGPARRRSTCMDEVEAALDDRNLGRLLDAARGPARARPSSIIITHQKRTMEIADALYGVTMRGDGVSTVISQRLRERATA